MSRGEALIISILIGLVVFSIVGLTASLSSRVRAQDGCMGQGLVPVETDQGILCFEPEAVRRAMARKGVDTEGKMP